MATKRVMGIKALSTVFMIVPPAEKNLRLRKNNGPRTRGMTALGHYKYLKTLGCRTVAPGVAALDYV
jgi:hypothetical protein